MVGRSFGVLKLRVDAGLTFDFGIPRRESKVGVGHTGFSVELDPSITLEEAAARRDYTINALMFDPRERRVLDFFGGEYDLRNSVLRHTTGAFSEDPLRVLRGMQFAARFRLSGASETFSLCREIAPSYGELAIERVWEEWFKWATKSAEPSRGLRFLAESGWIAHFPEIRALADTPQDAEWHPEGNVFVHTCHCLDELSALPEWQDTDANTRAVLTFAVLAHDFAKPQTTHEAMRDGRVRIVSPGHEEAGGPLAAQFLRSIGAPEAIEARVVPLVTNHLAHLQTTTDRSVRRLARRLVPASIQELVTVMTADHFGRPPKPRVVPDGILGLKQMAKDLEVASGAPQPILKGRHLIDCGLEPGKHFSPLLAAAYEAQLDGAFLDVPGALDWLGQQGHLQAAQLGGDK